MKLRYLGVSLAILSAVAAYVMTAAADPQVRPDRKQARVATVLDQGAVGDGVQDDTAAIQELIDSQVGTIRFPAGNYRLTKPLVLNLSRMGETTVMAEGSVQLVMAGPGPALRFEGSPAAANATPVAAPDQGGRKGRAVVNGLTIVGAHAEADGIEAGNTTHLTLRGVSIRSCRVGVHLVQRHSRLLIDACDITETSGCGIYLDHATVQQANLVATHLSHCSGGGIVIRGDEVHNVAITGCDLAFNGSAGGSTANILVDSAAGEVSDVAITGCTLRQAPQQAEAVNLRVVGRYRLDAAADSPPGCGQLSIGNNVMSGAQTNIHLSGTQSVTIVGNTLSQGLTHNALIEDSSQVLLGQNLFARQPQYKAPEEAINDVVLRRCRDGSIQGLQLGNVRKAEAAITLDKCVRLHVDECTILDCDNVGIVVRECTNCRVGTSSFINDSRKAFKTGPVKVIGGSANRILEYEHFFY